MSEKQTGKNAASKASDVLQDGRTGDDSKSAAGSALSQAGSGGRDKNTSDQAASAASDVLQDDSTSKKSKAAAGSTLSETEMDTGN